ncbi:cytochrome p450 [Diplodia corticola]|uniref:Bifunctional cytochrome P450/NADPH--P450 reductase n=1 Tax=Diplodia corticola TaxID=236234 RepID=A0A1J9RDR1_9PEZI|nr:cytochrome p450 [Diplodia corticola]OJD38577.1 cytochrome p450 [Diplodia corticola]
MADSEEVPIPQVPGLPIIGNMNDFDVAYPLGSIIHMAETYGSIFRYVLAGQPRIVVSSQALVNEVCDEKRFMKKVAAGLEQVRNGIHDGLFTAYGPHEKNWGIAHRILIPAFGPLSIRGMFDEMHDIASQLVLKFARHGPNHLIEVTEDFTRLTLDTLALCAMDYRFNSFYSAEMHPFVQAMVDFLIESGNRSRRPAIAQSFYRAAQYKYDADISILQKTGQDVIDARRKNPTVKKDLLNYMLDGRDPKTGEGLSDSSIIDNMITFLIAGHETTSGMLSFTFHYLLKNPQSYAKAQQEVDTVIGQGPITVEHMSKLPYINAVLREALRLNPTAPMITVAPEKDQVIGGKYRIPADEPVNLLLHTLHRDPKVWGENAEQWDPDRMLDENFNRIQKEFPNSWKPFGNGMRACIGRPFAWQEAVLVVAILLQNFNFVAEDPSYSLSFKQSLTIKPKDFRMRAILRNGRNPTTLEHQLAAGAARERATSEAAKPSKQAESQNGVPFSIYYGSNTGTCEALARRLASDAAAHGFRVATIDSLDSAKENLPKDQPVAIVTASYEGQPADNAAHFVAWMESLKGNELDGVNYTVFGCGHHDWAATFHRIPNLVNEVLEQRGAKRVAPLGTADAGQGDIFSDFEKWEDESFWPAMKEKFNAAGATDAPLFEQLEVQVSAPRASLLKQEVKEARVVEAKVLSHPDVPEKRHIEIQLPSDMTYSVGDYLAILPLNPKANVARAMRYFGLAWDSMVTISAAGPTTLPTGMPVSAADLFGAYVELAQPASKRTITTLIGATKDEEAIAALTKLAGENFDTEVITKRLSVLDILERFTSITLPLPSFLQLQPPMRVRQYSISSSPLSNPSRVTLTYAVLDQPSLAAPDQHRHIGVASSYLSHLEAGDALHVSVRPSSQAFRLPADPEVTPIIMVAAGTGLAPFRGFVQERAAQIGAGRKLAPALLFYGCRAPGKDDLYKELFDEWEARGVVQVRRAYSRAKDQSGGCGYVQERLWQDRKEVVELFDAGAKVYVCGSATIGQAVSKVCCEITLERQQELGNDTNMERVVKWFETIRNDRFATDVFA